ncbi:MAG: efflux RND transporter periplasmic adaptor subunit [Pseudomonadota bacterium]
MTDHNAGLDGDMRTVDTHQPTAAKGLIFFLILAVIVGLLALFVLRQRSVEGPLVASEAPLPISVSVQMVQLQDKFEIDERFSGLISARRTSALGFSSGGRVERMLVDVGDKIQSGQRLAALDTRALNAQLKSAEAGIKEAEASHSLALATLERQVTLNERGHVSAQVVDEAAAQADTAAARIDAAKANRDGLRVAIDLANIRAPFSGTIVARYVDEGAITAPGTPVLELVEDGVLEARIGLPSKVAKGLTLGQVYSLSVEDVAVSATLRAMTDVIDASQRTVATVFDIDDPVKVPAGAVARIALTQVIDERGFWVPVSALTESQRGLWSVYIARQSGGIWIAQPGAVDIVYSAGERAFVRGAVRDGDVVILNGLQRITPGQTVSPLELGPTASTKGEG